jgi:hypothetical protein
MKKIIFSLFVIANLHGDDLQLIFNQGQKSAKTLIQTLGKEMKGFMKKGDIKGAVQFCSSNAYSLTEKVNKELGENISVKRVSTKFRNPANKPSKEEAKILFMLENTKQPILTKVSDGSYKLYKPLRIAKPVCLKCHGKGSDMPEEIRKTIHSIYPNDKATGYEFGDLRGAVIVTIKTEEKK